MLTIKAKVFQAIGGHRAPAQREVTHRLLKDYGYCPTGSRYMTRASVRDIFLGKSNYAVIRNNGKQRYPKQARKIPASLSTTRLRIGCHVWSGENFNTLKEWALNA